MPGSDIKAKEKIIISELLSQRVMPLADKKIKSFAFAKGLPLLLLIAGIL